MLCAVFGAHVPADLHRDEVLVNAFKHRAARILLSVAEQHSAQIKRGVSADVAWNNCLVDLVRASKAHCYVLLVTHFVDAVGQQQVRGRRPSPCPGPPPPSPAAVAEAAARARSRR